MSSVRVMELFVEICMALLYIHRRKNIVRARTHTPTFTYKNNWQACLVHSFSPRALLSDAVYFLFCRFTVT